MIYTLVVLIWTSKGVSSFVVPNLSNAVCEDAQRSFKTKSNLFGTEYETLCLQQVAR